MRPVTRYTICALAAAAMAAPAVAASNSYLTLGPLKEGEDARKGKEDKIEVLSWSFGVTRKGWDGTIKGATGTEKFGAVGGMHRDDAVTGDAATAVTSPRDAASGLPTGKRQHQPKGRAPLDQTQPLDVGSVTVNGSVPGCTVGAAYTDAMLRTTAARYELKDVQITSCARESVALNYSKVTVRGWDPAKKQE